jgi:hypothetical protein
MVFLFLVIVQEQKQKAHFAPAYIERSNLDNTSISNMFLIVDMTVYKTVIGIINSKQKAAKYYFGIEVLISRISWILH